jgi:hypothetical protein
MSIAPPAHNAPMLSTREAQDTNPASPRPAISEKKLAANRKNAQRSTGPRTPQGKASSSQNAATHHLCSTEVPLPNEDPNCHYRFSQELQEELNPQSPIQHILCTQIIDTAWRLRRFPDAQVHIHQQLASKMQNEPTASSPSSILHLPSSILSLFLPVIPR